MPTRKRESLFEAMADKSKKPDVCGYQPLDPKIVEAVMRQMRKGDRS